MIAHRCLIGLAKVVVLALSAAAYGEEGVLVAHVSDTEGRVIEGVFLGTRGVGSMERTDRNGKASIRLAPGTKSGTWVTLQLRGSEEEWVFISPWDRRVRVPPFDNAGESFAPVTLGKRGDRLLLENGGALTALTANIVEKLGQIDGESAVITGAQRQAVLKEQAAAFGLEPEEVDQAIRAWRSRAQDPFERGLASLYSGDYPEAERDLGASLAIRRSALEWAKATEAEAEADVVDAVRFLGRALRSGGKYRESVAAFREAIELRSDDPDLLYGLGWSLWLNGEFAEAERAFGAILRICGEEGHENRAVAFALHGMAVVVSEQGRYADAEPLYERTLQILKKILGGDHPSVAMILDGLGNLHEAQGEYEKAGPLYEGALRVREKVLGEEHPHVAKTLNNLANLYKVQGEYSKAALLYERSLAINEKVLGGEHPNVAANLNNLASLHHAQGEYSKAASLYERALKIYETMLGEEHPDVATILNNLAMLHHTQGDFGKAGPLLERALKIREKMLSEEHPAIATTLNNLAILHSAQGEYSAAASLYERSLKIRRSVLGEEHPDVAASLNNLASLHHAQGEYSKAASLYERALKVYETMLGEEHSHVAKTLNNLANLHQDQGEYSKAALLYERSLAINEKMLGGEHPDIAASLNGLASLHHAQGEYSKAAQVLKRALQISAKVLGEEHPEVTMYRANYRALLQAMEDPRDN